MIFYLVIFVILLISYYIYKDYCKENFDNCAGPTTTETPTTKGSCDLTNFSESPHRAEGPVPIGDYRAYLPGCPATNQYPVLNADKKPICRRCWNGTVAYPPTIQSAIELTTDSPCNMYDLLKPGTNDGGHIPWNPAPSPAGEGERWPSWEGDIYKGSGLITKDCKVQRPKCVCNPGWSGENCSWKKEIDINWGDDTFFGKISRILGYALIKKNYLQGISGDTESERAALRDKGKWDIEKSPTFSYDQIGLATWNGKDAITLTDRENRENEIKTTIKNAIINANTRLANTMNGKTQWFLFSNIFFTEPWEGGADWTGLTTYYIDEAWEILTSPNDAINTDHEAVSGWKMEQAEGNAIDDIGDEQFSQMEEIRDLPDIIKESVIQMDNNIIGKKDDNTTAPSTSFNKVTVTAPSGTFSTDLDLPTTFPAVPPSCLNSSGDCKLIESFVSFCAPSPSSCDNNDISKLSIIIDNMPEGTDQTHKKLLFCLVLEKWGNTEAINIPRDVLDNMPNDNLKEEALWEKSSNNSTNIKEILQKATAYIYNTYKTQLCYTQLYSRLYTFHLQNLINKKGCDLYTNMRAVKDVTIHQEDYYDLFIESNDVATTPISSPTCSSSEAVVCPSPSINSEGSNHNYTFGILNFYYHLKEQDCGDITNNCLEPNCSAPSSPTSISEITECSIQQPNHIVHNKYGSCEDIMAHFQNQIKSFLVDIANDITPAVIKRILDAANITEKTLDYQTTIIKELEIIIPKYITTRSDWYILPIYNKYSAVEEISNHILHSKTANLNNLLDKEFGNESFFLTKNSKCAPPPPPPPPPPPDKWERTKGLRCKGGQTMYARSGYLSTLSEAKAACVQDKKCLAVDWRVEPMGGGLAYKCTRKDAVTGEIDTEPSPFCHACSGGRGVDLKKYEHLWKLTRAPAPLPVAPPTPCPEGTDRSGEYGLNFGYDTYKEDIIDDCKNMCTGELAETECGITGGVETHETQASCSPENCDEWCKQITEEGKGKWLIDFNINGEKNKNDYELRLKLIEKIRREKATHGETERMMRLKENIEDACAPSPTGNPSPACIELTQAYEIAQRGEAEREYQEERCVLDTEKGKWYAKIGYGGVNELWNNEISVMTGRKKKCLGRGGGVDFVIPPTASPGYQNAPECSPSPNSLPADECYAKLTYSPTSRLEQCIHSPSREDCDREYRKANLIFQRRGVPKGRLKCAEDVLSNAEKITWANGYNNCNLMEQCSYPAAYVGSQISVKCKTGYVASPNSVSMCVLKDGESEPAWTNIKCVLQTSSSPTQMIEEEEKELAKTIQNAQQVRNILSSWTVEESSAVSQVGLLNNDFNEEESQELIPEKKEEKSLFDKISQFMWF